MQKLTGTFSEVAGYEFTTLTCIPGVIQYKGAKIQVLLKYFLCHHFSYDHIIIAIILRIFSYILLVLIFHKLLDLPGIIEGAKDGKGRGRQVIAVGRTCNLILIVLDSMKPMTHKKIIEVFFLFLFFLLISASHLILIAALATLQNFN